MDEMTNAHLLHESDVPDEARLYELDRTELFTLGMWWAHQVLEHNGLRPPEYVVKRLNGPHGVYVVRRKRVEVDPPTTPLAVRTPGYGWSFPGWKADRTIAGVLAHETGHHVDSLFDHPRLTGWTKEPKVSGYEPDRRERFAEAFKLFVTNPDLLRVGRPARWALLTETLGLEPVHLDPWDEVLRRRGAHDKFFSAAKNWLKT